MTCGYKRRESNYLLALARLPASWREDEPGQGGHDNAFYAAVALSYASTGIKPVVGSLNKIRSEPPTKTPELPFFLHTQSTEPLCFQSLNLCFTSNTLVFHQGFFIYIALFVDTPATVVFAVPVGRSIVMVVPCPSSLSS